MYSFKIYSNFRTRLRRTGLPPKSTMDRTFLTSLLQGKNGPGYVSIQGLRLCEFSGYERFAPEDPGPLGRYLSTGKKSSHCDRQAEECNRVIRPGS